ncbi:MAG TPA: hypothetical protein DEP71_05060 [Porphyromonadaceae bacterium]|jgi:hypothetical protein|uniref:hypothetical protein n=1 Tax=Proteiniphilum sp. UBA1028 TaxID=1947251 RepID=UPI000ECB6122|nr:hypothetical protein [Proteiniphilum sp. UBA1028]HCB88638.1 hypothetical protein [Porphyromonadaceae bacterium]
MKKYLIEIVFYFLLPAALIVVVAEYSLRKIPNDYAFKNQWLTQNSHTVEILALGSSSVMHDVNPRYFHKKGFNAAHLSQSMKYDHMIFNKFIDKMPLLEYVIMGVDYWSPFGSLEDSPEWWRVKYYNIHYGSKYYRWEGKYNYELYFHNIGTFKRAANGFLTLLGLKKESHRTVDDAGYGVNYTLERRPEGWDNGKEEALRHNEMVSRAIDADYMALNKKYMEEVILKSAERGVKVILVNMPLYKSYVNNQNRVFLNQQKDFCHRFAEKYGNVSYYDFSEDQRFSEDDFYDANHLNNVGAKKLSLILDSIIVGR